MSTKPVYRSLSVERVVSAERRAVFATAMATVDARDEIVSHEPPWRLVTRTADPEVDLHEITVAIVETTDRATLFSVSAVLGPEQPAGALDDRVEIVRTALDARADAVTRELDVTPEPGA